MSTKQVNQPIGTIMIVQGPCGYYLSKKCPMNTSNKDPYALGFWQQITPHFYRKGNLIRYCKKYNIELPKADDMQRVKTLIKGTFMRLSKRESGPVWIRGEYDKSTKKFSIYKYDDTSHEIFVSGDRLVYTGFTF